MFIELFPTGWHLVATIFALGGALLASGIWIGNVNADRKSFKEVMNEVKTELVSLRESMNEVKTELVSLRESVKEVKVDQKLLRKSVKEVKADQKLLRESVKEVKADQKSLWESMKRVEANISHIPEHLPPPAVVETNSPIRLSNFGTKISANLSADKWAAEHAACLADKASGKQEFEIFEMCVEYVAGQFDNDPDLNRYFRKGAYEIGTGVEQVKKVHEVELRDALLALLDTRQLE